MNSKAVKLITTISDAEFYKISELAERLGVSPRLIRYEIEEASAFLVSEGLPEISVSRHEGVQLRLSDSQREQLMHSLSELDSYNYSLRSSERKTFMLMNMIAADDYLTSRYFAECLSVSKSCIDKDLAALKQDMAAEGSAEMECKTGSGNRVCGDERKLRSLCLNTVERYLDFSNYLSGAGYSHDFIERGIRAMFCDEWMPELLEIIYGVERKMERRLSFNSLRDIVLYLAIAMTRMSCGRFIEIADEKVRMMSATKEYGFARDIAAAAGQLLNDVFSESEICMVAIMLYGAKYTIQEPNFNEDWAQIQVLVDRLIRDMGAKLNFDFLEDDELYNALQLHLEPTVFKLKNHVPVVNPSLSVIKANYREVFDTLVGVIDELDTDLLVGITEDDIAYLALHFCASMERRKRYLPISRIAIVCVYGVGTASLMKELVCSRFNNVRVIATITSAELQSAELPDVDFIVSSIQIDRGDIPWVQVNAIPTDEDFRKIDRMMRQYTCKESFTEDSLTFFTDVLDTVEQYCAISGTQEFVCALSECFSRMGINIKLDKIQPALCELLTPEFIRVRQHAACWEDAVRFAGGLICASGAANRQFVKSLVDTVKSAGPYVVVSKGVALVHSKVACGVSRAAMSLVTLETPVVFHHPQNDPVGLILCLAPVDSYTHVRALKDFIKLLDVYGVNELCKADDAQTIFGYLKEL